MKQLNDIFNRRVSPVYEKTTESEEMDSSIENSSAILDASAGREDFARAIRVNRSSHILGSRQLHISYLGKTYDLAEGDTLEIGRQFQDGSSPLVSREHAILGCDQEGVYIIPYQTTNGTFVRRFGIARFSQLQPGNKYYAKEEDVIHLGGSVGSRMYFFVA